MITIFLRLFKLRSGDTSDTKTRERYTFACSLCGIFLNLLLFAGKLIAGFLSCSIAIQGDAFNNLSDASSSLITLIGVKISSKKADSEHPFGHGRMEYVAGLIVSMLIAMMGIDLLKDSVGKIIHPSVINGDYFVLTLIILIVSVLTKAYMWLYNRKYGKKLNSSPMLATATDSLCDAGATFGILISTVITHFTGFVRLDGICGVLVSFIVLFAAYNTAKETMLPLLGKAPDACFIDEIKNIVMEKPEIIGIHDLIVHDYGPGRVMISLHAEVPSDTKLSVIHEVIDNTEMELKEKLRCEAVIHCDPVDIHDEITIGLREDVSKIISALSSDISFHDFRVVHGKGHTNLIFDILLPPNYKGSESELCQKIRTEVQEIHPNHYCVIQIDRDFVCKKD